MSYCLSTLKEDNDEDTNFCVEITKEQFKEKFERNNMKAKK